MFCPQCSQPVPEHARFCPACGNELPTAGEPDPADEFAGPVHAPAGTLGYAGFWRRAVAFVIDSMVLMVVGFPLGLIPAAAVFTEDDPAALIGKRAIGIRVTDSSGARIHFRRATGRFFGKLLSGALFGLGFVMAAFTARRQALHDLLAGTLVVR